jgi:ABC-type multidrug transport system ATPase subunit
VEGPVIRFSGVSFAYMLGRPVLEIGDLAIGDGLTLVLGPNGSGKSTLLRLAAGVEKPDAGRVEVDGRDLWVDEVEARRGLAYVPEQPDVTPYATVADVLRLVCRLRGEPLARADEALDGVGLAGLGGRSVRELSMGQRRRAVWAAARIGVPRTIILDEPLETLDRAMRDAVVAWTRAALDRGARVLVATHELEPFVARAARAVWFESGRAHRCEPVSPAEADALARGAGVRS